MAEALGRFRKLYASGVIEGRRVNTVSLQAEAWLWRLVLIADDYGNLPADPAILKGKGAPLRKLTPGQIKKYTGELTDVGLIVPYSADGEDYLHIDGFESRQTSPNGRRMQLYPLPKTNRGNPVESGGIRMNPPKPLSLDQTRPDQIRPDKTRPDQSEKSKADSSGDVVGGGSGGSGSVVTELAKHSVNAGTARALARGGVTVHDVVSVAAEMRGDKTIRRPSAVLVHRLCEKRGITLQKGKGVDPAFLALQESITRRTG